MSRDKSNRSAIKVKVFPFMRWRWAFAAVSAVLLIISVWSLATRQLQFGLDFTGGTQVEVYYQTPVPLEQIRQTLVKAGYTDAVVVNFGSDRDILVRLSKGFTDRSGQTLVNTLRKASGTNVELRRVEFVGPQVGAHLREQGGLAMLLALGVVMLYIAVRFQYKFAIGAVLALVHDVVITLGFFSFFRLDFDLTVLAAVLAIIGYSLNDTIVVFDRIRENFRKLRISDPGEIIDISISQTLVRTFNTSFTTALVVIALLVFGGELIRGFATAMLVGITAGTYSSIYIASNLLMMTNIRREDLIVPVKEGSALDNRP